MKEIDVEDWRINAMAEYSKSGLVAPTIADYESSQCLKDAIREINKLYVNVPLTN